MTSAIIEPIVSSQNALSVRPFGGNLLGPIGLVLSYAGHRDFEDGVKRINAFRYFLLGPYIHKLAIVTPDTVIGPEVLRDLYDGMSALVYFRGNEDAGHFRASIYIANAAIEIIERTINRVSDFAKQGLSPTFGDTVSTDIQDAMHRFQSSLERDLSDLPLFCVEEKSNYSIDRLIKGASKHLPPAVTTKITPRIAEEIDESGKCLAFSCPTASGFHILRAAELLVKELIARKGLPMPAPNRCNWGEYIQILKNGGVAKEVTDLLQIVKDNYRNPIMHPEDTLDIVEATSLFGICQSGIEVLCRHIP